MKIIFYIAFILMTSMGIAQPVINRENQYFPKDYIASEYWTGIDSITTPGAPGADQVWDFSRLEFTYSGIYYILAPSEVAHKDFFTDADFVLAHRATPMPGVGCPLATQPVCINPRTQEIIEWDTYHTFLKQTQGGMYFVGGVNLPPSCASDNDLVLKPNHLPKVIAYPFTYGDTLRQSFTSKQYLVDRQSGPLFDFLVCDSTSLTIADGYGKLITPYQSYDNALRVHKIYRDSFFIADMYEWYVPNHPGPVLSYTSSGEKYGQFTYTQSDFLVGLKEPKTEKKLNIKPNPSTRQFSITLPPELDNGYLSIFDLQGRVVFAKSVSKGEQPISPIIDLVPGVYVVCLNNKGSIWREKLVVK